MADSDIQIQIDEKKHIVCQVVHATLFLGKQGLLFHGDVKISAITNSRIFFALLNSGGQHMKPPKFEHICNCHNISPLSSVQILLI